MSTTTHTTRAHEGRGRYVVTTGVTAVVVIGAGLIASARSWSRLPATVASHWGPNGVDSVSGKTSFLVTIALVLAGLNLVLGGMGIAMPSDARRLLAAVTGAALSLVAVLGFGALLAQVGTGDPLRASIPPVLVVLTIASTLVVALLLWRLNPPPAPVTRSAGQPLPGGAATVPVTQGQQVAWFGRSSPNGRVTAVLAVVVAAAALLSFLSSPWTALIPLAVGLALMVALHATVVVDQHGVRVTSTSMAWLTVPLDQVVSADHREIDPLRDFGGYGMRYRHDRRGYVVRKGDALELRQADGTTTYVSLTGAPEAAAVVNTLLRRLP